MHYLSNSTIYHQLEESLKPRIQRIVELKFGQSLSQAGEDIVIAELYAYLTKQSQLVLNSLYSQDEIRNDVLTASAQLNIETWESDSEILKLFLCLASDAEGDNRFKIGSETICRYDEEKNGGMSV